jgi:Uma2 family endonuclease
MTSLAPPITVEQFFDLPEPENGYYELHEGEVVLMTMPRRGHNRIKDAIVDLLKPRLTAFGVVSKEYPFRAGQHTYRRADVAVVSRRREEATALDDVLADSPELVIGSAVSLSVDAIFR